MGLLPANEVQHTSVVHTSLCRRPIWIDLLSRPHNQRI